MLVQPTLERNNTELEGWLIAKIATYVKLPRELIQPDKALTDYGLDSVYALTLVGDIEDHLSLQLNPTLMWDFPTVHALTAELNRILRQVPACS